MATLQRKLQDIRSTLTPAQARIADYVMAHTLDAALLTATELAQEVKVDPATVVRFAQKLGYAGYLELKEALGDVVRGTASSPTTFPGSIGQTLDQAQQTLAADYKFQWERVDRSQLVKLFEVLGMPAHLLLLSDSMCSAAASWLADMLRDQGFRVDLPGTDPAALGASMLTPTDYDRVLILEGVAPSPTLEHIAQVIQQKNIRCMAILGSSASQIVLYSEAFLRLETPQDPAGYPATLQHILTTVLLAVRQWKDAHQNGGLGPDGNAVVPASGEAEV